MGNTESKDAHPAASPSSQSGREQRGGTPRPHRSSSRRVKGGGGGGGGGSGGGGGGGGAAAPLPTETLVTSSSSASPSTSTQYAHGATVPASPRRAHQRARSITTSTPRISPEDIANSQRSAISAMGQADSKVRPPSRANTLPIHASLPPDSDAPPQLPPEEPTESQPVAVPPHNHHAGPHDALRDLDDYIPTGYSESPYGLPPANYSRPPRLPLPIEEEVYTPGSPIITPQDVSAIKDDDIEGGSIPRIASVRSSTTMDEDDVGDNDAFDTSGLNHLQLKVPLKLAWNGGGDKIFVTGTFCNWEKKIKLPRNKDGSAGFSANVHLPPGTHHVKFLVDGEMVTSPDLPTTVDWTNILVNYVEVVAPLPEDGTQPPEPAKPMPIPGAALTAGQGTGMVGNASTTLTDETQPPGPEVTLPSTLQATDGSTKSEQHTSEATASIPIPTTPAPRQTATQPVAENQPKPTPAPAKQKVPRPKYTNAIPEFLVDLDNYNNPEDERYQRAQRVSNTLPQPPSLPMFLNKSILNGATPHKDDASVLIMPNHTVLNHLATSSIRSGVLATSGTTRYKRKFLTTIMYKPTSDNA